MKYSMKPSLRENPDYFILHVGTNDLNTERFPELFIVPLLATLKGNFCDLSVSNIILPSYNSNLNGKRRETKLRLNQKGSKVLGDAFSKEISNVFNWHYNDKDSKFSNGECQSKFSLEDKKRINAKTILKSIRQENTNKLAFARININLLRNKFQLLGDQVKGNIDVVMISETKIEENFLLGSLLMGGFSKLYSLDRDSLGGVIFLYVREDILKI